MSIKNKNAQLGMSYGKANSILKKSIMFQMAQELHRDICYQCGYKIETVEEFSVEHKIEWLGNDTGLFWDLANIAFSHLSCNRPRPGWRGDGKHRRIAPLNGHPWCTKCQAHKPPELFRGNKSTWTGYHWHCKECERAYR